MYYISNIDHKIYNSDKVKTNIVDCGHYKEVEVLDGDGGVIDSCTGYERLEDLIDAIS